MPLCPPPSSAPARPSSSTRWSVSSVRNISTTASRSPAPGWLAMNRPFRNFAKPRFGAKPPAHLGAGNAVLPLVDARQEPIDVKRVAQRIHDLFGGTPGVPARAMHGNDSQVLCPLPQSPLVYRRRHALKGGPTESGEAIFPAHEPSIIAVRIGSLRAASFQRSAALAVNAQVSQRAPQVFSRLASDGEAAKRTLSCGADIKTWLRCRGPGRHSTSRAALAEDKAQTFRTRAHR